MNQNQNIIATRIRPERVGSFALCSRCGTEIERRQGKDATKSSPTCKDCRYVDPGWAKR
jgi:transposase-like protein